MSFTKKGDKRPPGAGRKKGTGNKLPPVSDVLHKLGVDPVNKLVELEKELTSPQDRKTLWLDLLEYTRAKPKEMEQLPSAPTVPEAEAPTAQLLSLVKASKSGAVNPPTQTPAGDKTSEKPNQP